MIYIIIDNVWIFLVINIICLKIIIYGLLIEVLIGIGWWYCNLLLELIKRLILYLFIVLIGWVIDILRLFLIFKKGSVKVIGGNKVLCLIFE